MKALLGAKIDLELNDRLLLTAKTTRLTISEIVEQSIAQYLDQPAELIGDRFSVIEKKLLQIQRRAQQWDEIFRHWGGQFDQWGKQFSEWEQTMGQVEPAGDMEAQIAKLQSAIGFLGAELTDRISALELKLSQQQQQQVEVKGEIEKGDRLQCPRCGTSGLIGREFSLWSESLSGLRVECLKCGTIHLAPTTKREKPIAPASQPDTVPTAHEPGKPLPTASSKKKSARKRGSVINDSVGYANEGDRLECFKCGAIGELGRGKDFRRVCIVRRGGTERLRVRCAKCGSNHMARLASEK